MAGQFRTAGIVPKHASRHQGLSFGSVAEDNLILLKQRGYICPSAEATGEAAIARIITGEIDFKELPRSKTRVKKYALQAGHNNISIKVIDRTLTTPKFLMETVSEDLQGVTNQLKFHPNIAMPYDYFQSSMHIFLVTEYIQGTATTLIPYIMSKNHQEHVVRDIFCQINSAVKYAHEYGIFHRDLNPACIHVNERGHVKIQDFGLSPKLSPVQPAQLHEETKRVYTAPEVIKSRRYESKEADIYSMGIILYEMLHGKVPYTGFKNDILVKIYLRDLKFFEKVSQDVRELMRQMLHPDPWKRPTAATCLHHNWTCGIRQPSQSSPIPKVGKQSSTTLSKSHKMSSKYTYPDDSRVCARATVSRGSEKIVLCSRIPNKKMAYAMDLDYANMCAQLQPATLAKLEQKLLNKIKYPKPSCQSTTTGMAKDLSANKSDQPLLKPEIVSSQAGQSPSYGSAYIKDAMRICCIKKPLLLIPTQKSGRSNKPTGDLCTGCVFSSRAASPESDLSVFAFDHGDSEFSCGGDCEAEALGLQKHVNKVRVGPTNETKKCPVSSCSDAQSSTSNQSFLTSRSTQQLLSTESGCSQENTMDVTSANKEVQVEDTTAGDGCEVLTTASYKSERGSPVPSDLGSVEPEVRSGHQRIAVHPESASPSEHIHLPKITTEENLLKFMSNIPVPDTIQEPSPNTAVKPVRKAKADHFAKTVPDSKSNPESFTYTAPDTACEAFADIATEMVDAILEAAPVSAPLTSPASQKGVTDPIPDPFIVRNLDLTPTPIVNLSAPKSMCPMQSLAVGNVNSLAVPVPHYKLWLGRLQLSQKQYRATSNMPVVHGKAISKPGFPEAPGSDPVNKVEASAKDKLKNSSFPLITISHPQWAGKPLSAQQRLAVSRAAHSSFPVVDPPSPVNGCSLGPAPIRSGSCSPDCLSQVSNANSTYDDEPPWLPYYGRNTMNWRLHTAKQLAPSSSLVLQGITLKAKDYLSLSESLPELKHHPKRKSVPPIQCKRIGHLGKLRAALPKVKPEREEDNSPYFEGTRLYNPVEGSTKPEMAICQKSPPHNSPDSVF